MIVCWFRRFHVDNQALPCLLYLVVRNTMQRGEAQQTRPSSNRSGPTLAKSPFSGPVQSWPDRRLERRARDSNPRAAQLQKMHSARAVFFPRVFGAQSYFYSLEGQNQAARAPGARPVSYCPRTGRTKLWLLFGFLVIRVRGLCIILHIL